MERIWTTDLPAHAGQRVRLAGWLHRLRRLSNVTFLILRDGKGLAQIVVEDPSLVDRLAGLQAESVLAVVEAVVADAQARRCTAFVNLGDILSGPLWPAETAD